tara:strand:- start:221 stop:868 length:648 start_codon:yes stop_codon:yes gene_type:complete
MIPKIKYFFLSIVSLLILIVSLIYVYLNLKDYSSTPIKFDNFDLNSDYKIQISKNINDINNFLSNYIFIDNYQVFKSSTEIRVIIELKKPFAKNNINREIIFEDDSIASYSFFDKSFIKSIALIDISKESLSINDYLKKSYKQLQMIFDIIQIEYIDDRRYNIYLNDNTKVMLPKKIDQKFLIFLENNFNILKKNSKYNEFIDLRNFHEKTIRVK